MEIKKTAPESELTIPGLNDNPKEYQNVIGVDVASKKLDLHQSFNQSHRIIENDLTQIKQLVESIVKSNKTTLVVMEATGGYETLLVDALQEHDIDTVVANPLQVRNFARGFGILEKNDKIDAAVIARFGQVVKPKIKPKTSPEVKSLRAMVHRRDQMLCQIQAERNRLGQTHDRDAIDCINRAIGFYKVEIKAIDKKIAVVLKECEELSSKAEIMNSVPGVGVATIAMLLSELPELGGLNRGQVAKLVGVAPIAKDSGQKEGKRSTHAGRSMVRKVLYMAALISTKHNPVMKAF